MPLCPCPSVWRHWRVTAGDTWQTIAAQTGIARQTWWDHNTPKKAYRDLVVGEWLRVPK